MRRLLVLLVLALAPLMASAHGGHQSSSQEPAATPAALAATNGAIRAIAAAPSRCPGGGHEDCCCHDLTCSPAFQPAPAVDAGWREVALLPVVAEHPQREQPAPRSVALVRYPPRGPPVS